MTGRAWIAVAAAALVAACGDPIPAPDVVASIAGRQIPYSEFEGFLRRQAVEVEVDLGSDVLSGLFDQFLEEELLRRLAVDRGVVSEEDDAWHASRALVAEVAAAAIDDAEVERFYARNQERYRLPERVRLRQILVEERSEAEEALAALEAGEAFAEVAERFARDGASVRGGDQGVLAREDLPPVFADTIFELGEGELSGIVAADYGFHIFQVVARLSPGQVPLEVAAPEIREELRREGADRALDRLAEEAAGRYNLEVFARNLPFNYEGSHGV